MIFRTRFSAAALALVVSSAAGSANAGACGGPANTRFFSPPPNPGAVKQIKALARAHKLKEAFAIASLASQPHAVWLAGGTPSEVEKQVRETIRAARLTRTTPVFVAYNLPFRDCAQYSAGGALDQSAYHDWIRGVSRGIGKNEALVMLEPDGLGLIPYNTDLQGVSEWCRPPLPPSVTSGEELRDARYAELNDAVSQLSALPNTSVYLDATHTSWLGAGEAAYRLSLAGVDRVRGFFVNASNYEPTPQLDQYGSWVAKCLWFASSQESWGYTGAGFDPAFPKKVGRFEWCASQYYPAIPDDYSTWGETDQWYSNNVESQGTYPGEAELAHFVMDTSRNGLGPWRPAPGTYSDAQTWCNPPQRGAGLRSSVSTGSELLDAYLWIKVPGESDGSCTRGTPGPIDPEWGLVDPAAGEWFPEQALQLALTANPPLF